MHFLKYKYISNISYFHMFCVTYYYSEILKMAHQSFLVTFQIYKYVNISKVVSATNLCFQFMGNVSFKFYHTVN